MLTSRSTRARATPACLNDGTDHGRILTSHSARERNPTTIEMEEVESEDEIDDVMGSVEDEERKSSDDRPPVLVWSKDHTPVEKYRFLPPHRLHEPLPQCTTPLDFFLLFVTDEFWEECVSYTNDYAVKKQAGDDKAHARAAAAASSHATAKEEETTVEEIKALVGSLIFMGIVNMDNTRDYWNPLTQQEFVTAVFPRDRFLWLIRHFRVSDVVEEKVLSDDRLHKIRRLVEILQTNIILHCIAKAEISVDEAMIPFKGRSVMRQHIARKASPIGFKVWMLVDVISNYVLNFDIFTGMKDKRKEEDAAMATVLKLIDPLPEHRWYRIGMDNYFTSVALFLLRV